MLRAHYCFYGHGRAAGHQVSRGIIQSGYGTISSLARGRPRGAGIPQLPSGSMTKFCAASPITICSVSAATIPYRARPWCMRPYIAPGWGECSAVAESRASFFSASPATRYMRQISRRVRSKPIAPPSAGGVGLPARSLLDESLEYWRREPISMLSH